MSFSIPTEASAILRKIAARAGERLQSHYYDQRNPFLRKVEVAIRRKGMLAPVRVLDDEVAAWRGEIPSRIYRDAFLARFALDLPGTLHSLNLPPSILDQYPDLLRRLAVTIPGDYADYALDAVARDLAHVTGLFVPAIAQDIDRFGRLDPRMILSDAIRRGHWAAMVRYAKARMWRPFIEFHTDSRYLTHFGPPGIRRAFHCAADLLRGNPALAGLFGSSWLYDPALAHVSPRLAYFRAEPEENGALYIWNGPTPIDTARAISKSETRRRLHEAGKYQPICYTMIWPRRELIAWSRANPQSR